MAIGDTIPTQRRHYRSAVQASVILMLAASASQAMAQRSSPEIVATVPDNPAFMFLGIAPTKIVRPGGARELGAAVLSGIGEDGRVLQGVALEIAPWSLVPALTISLDDYQHNAFKYILANAQISIGTARAAGDSAATDLALGLRITLYDGSDPMRSSAFTGAAGTALRKCTGQATTPLEQIARCSDSTMAQLHADFADSSAARWNDWSLSVGAALGTRFRNSKPNSTDARGAQVWVAGAAPIGKVGHLIGQGSWQHTPADDNVGETDLVSYGARVILGIARFGMFGELLGESTTGGVEHDGVTWSMGAELRIAASLWLSAGLGSRFDKLVAEDRTVVLANLRFGLADGTRLASLR